MFKGQNWKIKLGYIGFGSIFGGLFTIIGMLASDVAAQKDKFGDIECASLIVVDAAGNKQVILGAGAYGGHVGVMNKDGEKVRVLIGVDKYGGQVNAVGKGDKVEAALGMNETGGSVSVYDKGGEYGGMLTVDEIGGVVYVSGKDGKSSVSLNVDENGGVVVLKGKSKGMAGIGINEYGNGAISTWDKNGYRQ